MCRLAMLTIAVGLGLGVPAARADDTPPQGMPLSKGDTNPAGDYATHYTYGPPLMTYSTDASGSTNAPKYPGAKDVPVVAGEPSSGTPAGMSTSPAPAEPSR